MSTCHISEEVDMPMIGFTIKIERIDEELLYRDPGGGAWL